VGAMRDDRGMFASSGRAGCPGPKSFSPAQGSTLETIDASPPAKPYIRSGSNRHGLPGASCHMARRRSALEWSRNTNGSRKES
jgi:hypothetical protein